MKLKCVLSIFDIYQKIQRYVELNFKASTNTRQAGSAFRKRLEYTHSPKEIARPLLGRQPFATAALRPRETQAAPSFWCRKPLEKRTPG